MDITIGIDLGTTFSATAFVAKNGLPRVLENSDGQALTPSVIYFGSNEILIGNKAKEKLAANDERAIAFFKRFMGNPNWAFFVNDKQYNATELSAILLKKLKQDAESTLGHTIDNAVITVPAYFSELQRRNTIEAGRAAGLNVLRIINEPTAAAIAYGFASRQENTNVLVYDLGGGTFDVSIVNMDHQNIQVIATGGDHELGGRDWDDCLLSHVATLFEEETGDDLFLYADSFGHLLVEAEKVKKDLSDSLSATFEYSVDELRRVTITRAFFEQLTRPLLERTLSLCDITIEESGLSWSDIHEVLLIGGSSRMPMISEGLYQKVRKRPLKAVDVDKAVAIGAAIQAAKDSERQYTLPSGQAKYSALAIKDITSHSLGMVAINEDRSKYINSILIPKNSPIPASQVRPYKFRTSSVKTNQLEVYITQGESENPLECNILGKYTFADIQHSSNTDSTIDISYSYDENGTVNVLAHKDDYKYKPLIEPVPSDMEWLAHPPENAAIVFEHLSVYLVFDLSGSMSGAPLKEAKLAAQSFVEKLDLTNTSIGLAVVADKVQVIQGLCQNAKKLNRAIKSLEIGIAGFGNGSQPFSEMQKQLKRCKGLKFVVVLADGVWERQNYAVSEAKRCHENDIDIVAIGFGSADEKFLKAIASSEESALLTDLSHLVDSFDRIAQVLNNNIERSDLRTNTLDQAKSKKTFLKGVFR